jgi:hypothetical protein
VFLIGNSQHSKDCKYLMSNHILINIQKVVPSTNWSMKDEKSIGNGNEEIIIKSLLIVFSLGDREIKSYEYWFT